jgi:hypothetical protein
MATDALNAAITGRRLTHFAARSSRVTGLATIGSPARNRRRSSASAAALAYRLPGSLSRHFRQIVSRSGGSMRHCRRGGTGSSLRTIRTVSIAVAAWNGGRPVTRA